MVAALTIALSACVGDGGTRPHDARPLATRMTALAAGVLSVEDGCVKVGPNLLVWPPEFTVKITAVAVEAIDGQTGNRTEWRIGDTVRVGGGQVAYSSLNDELRKGVGPCASLGGGTFWLVGGFPDVSKANTAVP